MILTMSLITLSLLVIGIYGTMYIDYTNTWQIAFQIVGFLGAIFVSAIFFGAIASTTIERIEYEKIIPTDITRSKKAVYVEFDNYKTLEFTSHEDFLKIDTTTTTFLVNKQYNYYNILLHNIVKDYTKEEAIKLLKK